MSRSSKVSVFVFAAALIAAILLIAVFRPRGHLIEQPNVSEVSIPSSSLTLSRAHWVSDEKVVSIQHLQINADIEYLNPLLTDTLTGEQEILQGLAELLKEYPLHFRSTFSYHNEWCLFYIETGEDLNFIRLLTTLDGSERYETSIDRVIYHVFWMPEDLAWLEFQYKWGGSGESEWYFSKGKAGERKFVREESRIVEPIGFTQSGTFVVATTQFPSSPPITLEYWQLEPVPQLLKTETVNHLPGNAFLVKASPTGEKILWGWSTQEISFGDHRISPPKIGYSTSSIDGKNFKKLGTFPYDSSSLGTFWTPSGNAFSFEHGRKYYLLELEFGSDSKDK